MAPHVTGWMGVVSGIGVIVKMAVTTMRLDSLRRCVAALPNHVLSVFLRCACAQMSRVAARAIVATVHDNLTVLQCAARQEESHAMRSHALTAQVEPTIACSHDRASPRPAFLRILATHPLPEPHANGPRLAAPTAPPRRFLPPPARVSGHPAASFRYRAPYPPQFCQQFRNRPHRDDNVARVGRLSVPHGLRSREPTIRGLHLDPQTLAPTCVRRA